MVDEDNGASHYYCVVLVLDSYDPNLSNDKGKEPRKYKPNCKNLLKVDRGDILMVKNPWKWWLQVDVDEKSVVDENIPIKDIDATKKSYKLFIPSLICVPIDIHQLTIHSEQLADISDTESKIAIISHNCLIKEITLSERKYFPQIYHFYGDIVQQLNCPCDKSNIISNSIYHWLDRLIWIGYRRALLQQDSWECDEKSKSQVTSISLFQSINQYFSDNILVKKLRKNSIKNGSCFSNYDDGEKFDKILEIINNEAKNLTPPPTKYTTIKRSSVATSTSSRIITPSIKYSFLLKILFSLYKKNFIFAIILKLFHDILHFCGPFLLGEIIKFAKNINSPTPQHSIWYGYVLALTLFAVKTTQTFALNRYFDIMTVTGNKIRCMLISAIYQKMLLIDTSKSESMLNSADQMNLLSVDSYNIQECLTYINVLWSAPVQILLALGYLAYLLRISVLPGLGVIFFFMPINLVLSKILKKILRKQMQYKDQRMHWIKELLNGMRLVKLYGWEYSFVEKVMTIRKKELLNLRKLTYLNSFLSMFWDALPFLIAVLCFVTFIGLGNDLNAEIAFTALSIILILRFPLAILPDTINTFVQMRVSVTRIENYLLMSNIKNYVEKISPLDPSENSIVVHDGNFCWAKTEASFTLSNINLNIPHGKLVAVIGQVGSGKSTLISALLGLTRKLSGTVTINGSTSYVAQTPWIQNMSLKNNILFYNKMDNDFFKTVIDNCCLLPDLQLLSDGIETEIGENGVNLSGGQRQRVSLARAVYNNSDIYLLDDVLSAVDSHVAKSIFDNVLSNKGMLSSKTRILVTHKLDILPYVDHIIMIEKGVIIHSGTYKEISEKEFFKTYFDLIQKDHSETTSSKSDIKTLEVEEEIIGDDEEDDNNTQTDSNVTISKIKQELMRKEEMKLDKVNLKTFHAYISAMGYFGFFVSLVFVFGTHLLNSYSSLWLAQFSSNIINIKAMKKFFIGYGSMIASQFVASYTHAVIFALCAYVASRDLHNRILKTIVRAPMSFFETTPLGRLMNIFSNDIYRLDVTLPRNLRVLLSIILSNVILFGIIVYNIPLFVVPLLIMIAIYVLIQNVFILFSSQMQRLESISKSPIFSKFLESSKGVNELRAFDKSALYFENFCKIVDKNQSLRFIILIANRWLSVRLETIGNLLVYFSSTFCILSATQNKISPGLVGFVISYTANAVQGLNWLIRARSEVENQIVSVERISTYEAIDGEAPFITSPENRHFIENGWPSLGVIEYRNYSTRYRPQLPLSLKSLTFKTSSFEKIGIVGRTGAGKSSIIQSLFRIIEAVDGYIFIDGVDISKIGLHDLRKKITVIPQESFIFEGTIRENIDPLKEYTDAQIWHALECSHLKNVVASLDKSLDYVLTESGDNFSAGERQLLCLARAVLKNNAIIVLDEATASVDTYTDSIIQNTIRTQFPKSTILTIAHRLNTIMDYDRILVMKDGTAVEYDTPQNLLANTNSLFYSMAKDSHLV